RVADRAAPRPGAGRRAGSQGGRRRGRPGRRRCTVTPRRRGVGLTPMETRRDVIVRAAVLADELGYESFSVPEGWGLDSTPVLTEIALRTSRIQVASGVLSVWGRTPATLAMTAATLHQVSEGRYVLGLGASTRALAEGFHDIPFERPARTARRRPGRAPAAPGPAARPRAADLDRRPGPAHHERGRRTRGRLDSRADGAGPGRRLGEAAGPAAGNRRTARARPHGGGRSHRRRRRRPGYGPGHRRGLRRVVPDRHGRRLRPFPGRPGLRRRGQRGDRGEPAAQPAAWDDTPRGPGRPGPARRLRNPRPAPRAARALGPRRRHRHAHAAAGHALGHRRSHAAGRSARRLTGASRRLIPHKPSARSALPFSPHDLHIASTGLPRVGVTVGSLTSGAPTRAGTARGQEWTDACAASRPLAGS